VRGPGRICTGVDGFAGRCLATRPPGPLRSMADQSGQENRMARSVSNFVLLVPLEQVDQA